MIKPYFETKLGKLYHGDCLEIMKQFPNNHFDLCLTDPPYGMTACHWDSVISIKEMWRHLKKIIKKNNAIVLFGCEPFSSFLRMSNIKDYKYDWFWKKTQPTGTMIAKTQPMRIIENISVFCSKIYYPLMEKRSWEELKRLSHKSVYTPLTSIDGRKYNKTANRYDNKFKYPKNCIEIKSVPNRHKGKDSHPTQKPIILMEYLIKTYTKNSDVVLDFAVGSGTTAVACERLGRRWVGIEIEEKYCEIAAERIKAESQQGKLFETI